MHKEAIKSPNFSDVSNIDNENKEPQFHIISKLRAVYNSAQWEYQEFEIYLTKDEGILCISEWNSAEDTIQNLNRFIQITGSRKKIRAK